MLEMSCVMIFPIHDKGNKVKISQQPFREAASPTQRQFDCNPKKPKTLNSEIYHMVESQVEADP